MAVSLVNDFEEAPGTGVTLTAGSGGNTAGAGESYFDVITIGTGATAKFSSALAANGTYSAALTTPATATTAGFYWNTRIGSVPTLNFRAYVYLVARPATIMPIFFAYNGSSRCAVLESGTDGKFYFYGNPSTAVLSGTTVVPVGAWFRVEGFITGSSTAGQLSYSYYSSPDSLTAAETRTSAATANTFGLLQSAGWGPAHAAMASLAVNFDSVAISDSGPIGPATTAASGADTGSGADASARIALASAEAGSAAETASAGGASPSSAEGASAAEASSVRATAASADTATAAESGSAQTGTTPVLISDSDSSACAFSLRFADRDGGTAAEAVLSFPVTGAEAGTLADTSPKPNTIVDGDVFLWSELVGGQVSLSDSDSALAAEVVRSAGLLVTSSDTIAGTDSPGTFRFGARDPDTASGAETATVTARPRDAEAAHAAETPTTRGAPAGVLEGFSVVRAAVLGPSGAEAAQIAGVRGAVVALSFTAADQLADDLVVGTWYEAGSAQLTIAAGFASLPQLAATGYFTAAAPPSYAASLGVSSMPVVGYAPVVLRAAAADASGVPYTLDIVLYRVRLRLVFGTAAHKAGTEVSLTGTALPSPIDEAGTALPAVYYAPGAQLGYSFGRLAISPGAPPGGAVGTVFGRGT